MVLLIGAGLLLQSFVRALKTDPGFEPGGLLTFRIAIPQNHFTPDQTSRFSKQLQQQLLSLPGTQSATSAFPLPLAGGNMRTGFDIPGRPQPEGEGFIARLSCIGPDFFRTLKIPLISGRDFNAAEQLPSGPLAVIVNQAFADQYFSGQEAIGKHIGSLFTRAQGREEWQIVGIVGNVKRRDFSEEPAPEFYLPSARTNLGSPIFAMRVSGDPMLLAEAVRAAVAQADPAIPIYKLSTYDGLIKRSMALRQFQAMLLASFAAIALVLASVGLYASLSYMVAQRTTELGLRFALGARRQDVLGLVLRTGLMMTLSGIAIGVVASAFLTRLVGSLLYRTAALDAATYTSTTILLLVVSVTSSFLPAQRAARIEPAEALRGQ